MVPEIGIQVDIRPVADGNLEDILGDSSDSDRLWCEFVDGLKRLSLRKISGRPRPDIRQEPLVWSVLIAGSIFYFRRLAERVVVIGVGDPKEDANTRVLAEQ